MIGRLARGIALGGFAAAGGLSLAVPAGLADDGEAQAATAFFEHAYSGRCQPVSETRGLLDGPDFPRRHELTYKPSYASADETEEAAIVYEFFCTSGAYNVQFAYVLAENGFFEPLTFAVPALDITYEPEDDDRTVKSIRVAGYETNLTATNAEFDPAANTIVAHSYWRGLGDAWSEATWVFRDGSFVLKRYVADASYDRETEPQLTLDY